MSDVIIIGGGIIGMLTARELLQQGRRVSLLERQSLGREASWAGGGIVSPLYPWTYTQPVTALASWAQDAYPLLSEQLAAETGINPEFNRSGLLMLDPPAQDRILDWARAHQKSVEVLDHEQGVACEPAIGARFEQAVWWPDIGNVRNPRLLQSLSAWLAQQQNGEVHSHCEVQALTQLSDGSVRVETSAGDFVGGQVVVCAGAWSGKLLSAAGVALGVQPVRGQMLIFEPRPGLIRTMILQQGRYLIPRMDGRILVGSTLEHTAFDKSTTAEAKSALLAHAHLLVPELASVPVEAHWAGLRPGSPHGIPYIGKVPGWSNLYVNAGHFRNGLVLAPASARLMRNLLMEESPIVDPSPYDPSSPRPSAEMY